MNNFSRSDLKKRQRFFQKELKFLQLKALSHDLSMPKLLRLRAQIKLEKLKSYTKGRIKNRCLLTSRGKSTYKKLGTSRITLRNLASEGLMLGISKATW